MIRLATLIALPVLALALPARCHATQYTVQPNASSLAFRGTFQGSSFQGHFGQWNAVVTYDAGDLKTSRFNVTVDLASAKTGDSDRDEALPGKNFFNVGQYPTAHFVITGFQRDAQGQVIARGTLSLHGITRPLNLVVQFKPAASGTPYASMDISGSVDRSNFKVGSGAYADTSVIGATVNINAHLQLAPQ